MQDCGNLGGWVPVPGFPEYEQLTLWPDKGFALQRTRAFDKIRTVKRGCEAMRRAGYHPPRPVLGPGKEF